MKVFRRKPFSAYFPIQTLTRAQTTTPGGKTVACRIVEGYAFVNEWVGDGVNLLRSSMEAASADYMRWGAVREMHQPSAVGTAVGRVKAILEDGTEQDVELGVFWDEKGARLRSMVVDPDAILKLDTQVYRGYSVGVGQMVLRGIDCISCKWIENSLVDRPADPDAILTMVRGEGLDGDNTTECMQVLERSTFAECIPLLQSWAKDAVVTDACYELMDCLWEAVRANDRQGDLALATQSIDEFAAYLKEALSATMGMGRAEAILAHARTLLAPESVNRAAALEGQVTSLTNEITRLSGEVTAERTNTETERARAVLAEADLARVRAELTGAQARISTLEAQPDPTQPLPVRNTERTVAPFADPEGDQDKNVEKLRAELAELQRTAKDLPTEQERATAVVRISRLRQELASLGESA